MKHPIPDEALDDFREALAGLIEGVKREVDAPDHRGGSGYLLARLSDAEAALHRFDLARKAKPK